MIDLKPVSIDLYHEISQFLYLEARLLDQDMVRYWLEEIADREIRYRMVITEERFSRDKSPAKQREVMPYDDTFADLELRVKQSETGLQSMHNPPQRLSRTITNIEVFDEAADGRYRVLSHGIASRFRRQYEHEQLIYTRDDTLRRDNEGALRILSRRIEVPERVVRNKNLMFFL